MNQSPKWMALKCTTYTRPLWFFQLYIAVSRRAQGFFLQSVAKPKARAWVEQPLMQILVVVANIQVRHLKTEAGERFHGNSSWPWVSRSLEIGETHFQKRKCVWLFFFFFLFFFKKKRIFFFFFFLFLFYKKIYFLYTAENVCFFFLFLGVPQSKKK